MDSRTGETSARKWLTLDRSLLKGSFWALLYRLLSGTVSYGLYLVIPFLFGMVELGVFGLVQAWIVSLSTLSLLGFNVVLLRIISDKGWNTSTHALYRILLFSSIGISLVLGVVIVSFQSEILTLFQLEDSQNVLIWAIVISLPFHCLLSLNVEVIRACLDIRASEFFRNLMILLITFTGLLLLKESDHFHIPVMSYAIGIVLTAISSTFYIRFKHSHAQDQIEEKQGFKFKELILSSLPIMGSSAIQIWNTRLMVILLGIFTSPVLVGIFSFVFKLSTLIDFLVSAIKAPGAPMISKLFWKNQTGKLNDLLQSSVSLIAIGSLPMAIIAFFLSDWILSFGSQGLHQGVVAFKILIVAQLFNALTGLTGPLLNMTDNQQFFFVILLLAMILNLCISLILIPKIAVNGAALAFLLSTVFWNFLSARFVWKTYGIRTYFDPLKLMKSIKI